MKKFKEYAEERDQRLDEAHGEYVPDSVKDLIVQAAIGDKWDNPEPIPEIMRRYGVSRGVVNKLIRQRLTPKQREKRDQYLQAQFSQAQSERLAGRWGSKEGRAALMKSLSPAERQRKLGMWPVGGLGTDVPPKQSEVPEEFQSNYWRWVARTKKGWVRDKLQNIVQDLQKQLATGQLDVDTLTKMMRARRAELTPEQLEAIKQVLQTTA